MLTCGFVDLAFLGSLILNLRIFGPFGGLILNLEGLRIFLLFKDLILNLMGLKNFNSYLAEYNRNLPF